jgi:Core-2/I-Branching enzyme
MAVAYLIGAHHRPEQLVRLVERLTTPTATFYIHVDGRAPRHVHEAIHGALDGREDVHWVPRVDSYYAGFSLVRSVLTGLEEVRSAGAPPHTVLLSGQCYPLRPAVQIESFLTQRPAESLVEHFRIPTERWADEDGGLDRIRYRHYERVHFRTRLLRLPFPRRSFPDGLEPWGGSAWCVLSDDAVETVTAFRSERPDAYEFFRRTKSASEIFVQTVLMNSALRDRVANETVHHIEWPGGSHPRTFQRGDFDRLAASGKLFARKFDVARDEEILDMIDRELLGEG